MEHHNILGPSPTLTQAVGFFHDQDTMVEVRKGALPGSAMLLAPSYTPNRDAALLAALKRLGWAFEHRPMQPGQIKGEFKVLVRMEG